MFKLVSAIVALVAFTTGASADDYSSRNRSYQPPTFSWTGFYVGAHGGRGWGDAHWKVLADETTFVDLPPGGEGSALTSHNLNGWIGGGHVGYQRQFGAWVLGAELSLSGGHLDGTSGSRFQSQDDFYKTKVDGIFLGTVRVGYAWDRWLTYLKGGYASAAVKASIVDSNVSAGTWSSSERHHGWTIGTGLEYAWLSNVTVGLQYDYINLGDDNHSALGVTDTGVQQLWVGNIDTGVIHMITARISYKF